MNIIDKSFKLIDDIINNASIQSIGFYENVLKMVSSLYENKFSISIFFCENTQYVLKSAIKGSQVFSNYSFKNNLQDFIQDKNKITKINTKKDELFFENTFAVKLAIRDSVFGFMTLSSTDKIEPEVEKTFEVIVGVISYKIKDYELNEVFKIQLKAMQEAINEKESAY